MPKPRPLQVGVPAVAERDTGSSTAQNPLQGSGHPLLAPSRSPPTQLCPASSDSLLKTEGAQGPRPRLVTATEPRVTLTVSSKSISFLIDTGTTCSAMPAYSRKTKVSQVSVMGVDGLISSPQITEPLPCTLQDTPFFPFFSHTPKMPHSILGRDLLSKFKASITIPRPPSDLACCLTPTTSDVHLQQQASFCFSRQNSFNNSYPQLGTIPPPLCYHTSHLSFPSGRSVYHVSGTAGHSFVSQGDSLLHIV